MVWGAVAGAVVGGMMSKKGGGGGYYQDPRLVQAQIDEMNNLSRYRDLSWERGEEAWNLSKPFLEQGLRDQRAMQALSRGVAEQDFEYRDQYYNPLRERLFSENVLTPEAEQARIRSAGTDAASAVSRGTGAAVQQAARTAAKYGVSLPGDMNSRSVAMGAAQAGASNTARRTERADIDSRKAGALSLFSDNPLAGAAQSSALTGAGANLSANFAQQGQAPMAAASQYSRMPLISSMQQGQNSYNNYLSDMRSQPSALGSIAQLGATMYGAGMFDKADGGMVYADGGMPDGEFDAFPGMFGDGYADGGAVEDAYGDVTAGDGSGGMLSGPGDGVSDSIPALTGRGEPIRVANGEYIVPADVVEILGEDFFDSLVERLHVPAAIQRGEM